MTKTVIFDMGRVIIPFDFQRAYNQLGPLCRYGPSEISERLRPYDLVSRLESGAVQPRESLNELSEILELRCEFDQFCGIFSSIFSQQTLVPESFLAALRERYRLLLLPNTNAIHYDFVAREYPILKQFHQHILSYEVGALKPSPKIYQAAIKASGCAPEECFFTDDIPAYVEAARTQGIDAVVFENYEQIQRELSTRNVTW